MSVVSVVLCGGVIKNACALAGRADGEGANDRHEGVVEGTCLCGLGLDCVATSIA